MCHEKFGYVVVRTVSSSSFRLEEFHAPEKCERFCTLSLGPQLYAISGPDGKNLSDRWEDAQVLRGIIKDVWNS
jgi:hypothetical protein